MTYFAGEYDVAVIGAGHAGIETALAAARLGCHTAVFTINMDAVGNCPCNPWRYRKINIRMWMSLLTNI